MTPEDQNNSSEIQNNADSGCQTGPVRQGISPQSTPDDFFKLPMGFPSDDRTPTLPTSRRFLRNNCRQLRKETATANNDDSDVTIPEGRDAQLPETDQNNESGARADDSDFEFGFDITTGGSPTFMPLNSTELEFLNNETDFLNQLGSNDLLEYDSFLTNLEELCNSESVNCENSQLAVPSSSAEINSTRSSGLAICSSTSETPMVSTPIDIQDELNNLNIGNPAISGSDIIQNGSTRSTPVSLPMLSMNEVADQYVHSSLVSHPELTRNGTLNKANRSLYISLPVIPALSNSNGSNAPVVPVKKGQSSSGSAKNELSFFDLSELAHGLNEISMHSHNTRFKRKRTFKMLPTTMVVIKKYKNGKRQQIFSRKGLAIKKINGKIQLAIAKKFKN